MKKALSYSVHKFGGTSLSGAEKFKQINSLLTGQNEIIVVSAIQGTTSTLQQMLDEAKTQLSYESLLRALKEKHFALIDHLIPSPQNLALKDMIEADCSTIKNILQAIHLSHHYSQETQDLILGYGELWSGEILKAYLFQFRRVEFLDAAKVLFVYKKEDLLCIDWEKSKRALLSYLDKKNFHQLVITGFIASTLEGQRTILGRNGSDFSAAIFAKLLQATSLTIWTDVDGIYTADPNVVPSAFVMEHLSYEDALELSYFGAKVLHPKTIAPLMDDKIPIFIKNTFSPEKKGTCISNEVGQSTHLIKGISSIDHVALINIQGNGFMSVSGITARASDILYRAHIPILFIAQASSAHSICFAIPVTFVKEALKVLNLHLSTEIEKKQIEGIHVDPACSILSVVGGEMIGAIGIAGQFFNSLAKAGVNIRAISQGSSERNISVVIHHEDAKKALQAVHSGLYLAPKSISIGLIGPGAVGGTLLQQIQDALEKLKNTYQVNLYLQGIMNSKTMYLSNTPMDLSHWKKSFKEKGILSSIDTFIQHLASPHIPHRVIIDCTANKAIAKQYKHMMEKGIHVITPNKHANADDLEYYKELKALTRLNHHYFYEATVCAGLPVITTLQDLIKTGDDIESIEGVVSGTLSYIFHALSMGVSFSQAVLDAKAKGFTEPDPREDLSGMDVARKFVCLGREMGHEITLDEVKVHNLVPPELAHCPLDTFLSELPRYDHLMEAWIEKAKKTNERLHYMGKLTGEGTIEVSLALLPKTHPFSRLEGTDNMLVFHTKRYHDRPLVIQGPGAGAEVTAAGIFADLLRLVSVLS